MNQLFFFYYSYIQKLINNLMDYQFQGFITLIFYYIRINYPWHEQLRLQRLELGESQVNSGWLLPVSYYAIDFIFKWFKSLFS